MLRDDQTHLVNDIFWGLNFKIVLIVMLQDCVPSFSSHIGLLEMYLRFDSYSTLCSVNLFLKCAQFVFIKCLFLFR